MNRELPTTVDAGEPAAAPASACFTLRRLRKRYAARDGAVLALELNPVGGALEIPWNARVAVLGHSGSGKSTLLNILGLLDTPDSEPGLELVYDGARRLAATAAEGVPRLAVVSADERDQIRRCEFGFVFQFHHLIAHLSCVENVALPLGLAGVPAQRRREAAARLVDDLGLGPHARKLPAKLSGGEAQRIAVLRALVHAPRVVLADEPTGNLDAQNSAHVLDMLVEWQRRATDDSLPRTLLLATHNIVDAYQRCDYFLILHRGRLAEGRLIPRGEIASAEDLGRRLIPADVEPSRPPSPEAASHTPPAPAPASGAGAARTPRPGYLAYLAWRDLVGHRWSVATSGLMLLLLIVLVVVGWGLVEGKRLAMGRELETPAARRLDADCLLRGQQAIDPSLIESLRRTRLPDARPLTRSPQDIYPWSLADMLFWRADASGPTEMVDHFIHGRSVRPGDPLLADLRGTGQSAPSAFSSDTAWEIIVTQAFLDEAGYHATAETVWLECRQQRMPLSVRGVAAALPGGCRFLLPDGLYLQICSDDFHPDPLAGTIWLTPFRAEQLAAARTAVGDLLAQWNLELRAEGGRLAISLAGGRQLPASRLRKYAERLRSSLMEAGALAAPAQVQMPEPAVEVERKWTHLTLVADRLEDLEPIARLLEPMGLSVDRRYIEAIERLRRTVEPLQAVLQVLAIVAGGVVLLNLVLATFQRVQQSRYEIGILKALGMKSRHVLGVLVGEAAAVGGITSLAGVAAGVWLGGLVSREVASGWFVVTPGMVLIVVATGTLIAVLACVLGAGWIVRLPPVRSLVR